MHRCLFLDDAHIAHMCGLTRRAHPAKRHPANPLLTKAHPWEHMRFQLYGRCVVYNPQRKRYQLFYIAQPAADHYPNLTVGGSTKVGYATLPAYAESDDGVHWHRPLRSDVAYQDQLLTNLLDLHDGQSFEAGILYDPHDPDGQRRYKALVWDQHFVRPIPGKTEYIRGAAKRIAQLIDDDGNVVFSQPYDDFGLRAAFSADGIHWRKHPGWVLPCYSDTGQSPLYDPRLGKYVAFGRFNWTSFTRGDTTYDGTHLDSAYLVGRSVSRIESDDFLNWSEPELVLAADCEDPASLQINSMPVDLYEGLYIGLLEVDQRPLRDAGLPLQLASSRDGRHWTRVAARATMLEPAQQDAWDDNEGSHTVRPATGLFVADDEVRFYYCGSSRQEPFAGMGMANWRRDGFVSLRAAGAEGELLTRAFVVDGPELHLNIDAAEGEATVQLCDVQGQPVLTRHWDEPQATIPSEPIHGDHMDVVVRWPAGGIENWIGKPLSLRIRLRNADLYSLWTA
tara:strand:- start:982 stop:2505 length:1524 start_codon:yes stop_codon:yes gene_type:complete